MRVRSLAVLTLVGLAFTLPALLRGDDGAGIRVRVTAPAASRAEGTRWCAHGARFLRAVFATRLQAAEGGLRASLRPDGRDLLVTLSGRGLRSLDRACPRLEGLEAELRLLDARPTLGEGRLRGDAVEIESAALQFDPEELVGLPSDGNFDLREMGSFPPGAVFSLKRWKARKGTGDGRLFARALRHELHLGARTGRLRNRSKESLLWFRGLVASHFPHQFLEGVLRLEALPGGRIGGRVLFVLADGKSLSAMQRLLVEEKIARWLEAIHRRFEKAWRCRFWLETLDLRQGLLLLRGQALVNVDAELWEAGAAVRLERRPPGMVLNPLR